MDEMVKTIIAAQACYNIIPGRGGNVRLLTVIHVTIASYHDFPTASER